MRRGVRQKEGNMFYIGCHLSCAKGFLAMGKDAERIGATTFQFFTRNPRGGSAKALSEEDIRAFLELKKELGLGPLVACSRRKDTNFCKKYDGGRSAAPGICAGKLL